MDPRHFLFADDYSLAKNSGMTHLGKLKAGILSTKPHHSKRKLFYSLHPLGSL